MSIFAVGLFPVCISKIHIRLSRMNLIVDVKVLDLDRAVKFYTEVLGLPCRIKADGWAGIVVGDAEIHLYVGGGVTESVEFYVDDIDAEAARLSARGVQFFAGNDKPSFIEADAQYISEFPWGRLAYFRDSEGNELALVKDFF